MSAVFVATAATIAMLVLILAVHSSGIREWWQRMTRDRVMALLNEVIDNADPWPPESSRCRCGAEGKCAVVAPDHVMAEFELQMRGGSNGI